MGRDAHLAVTVPPLPASVPTSQFTGKRAQPFLAAGREDEIETGRQRPTQLWLARFRQ